MSKIDHTKMSKYIDGKLVKKGTEEASEEGKFYWWRAEDANMAAQINSTIKFIQTHSPTRLEQLTASTRLYGNTSAFNFIGPALSRTASASANAQSNRISFNLCASVVDTLTAKISKNKVIPTFLTSGGVWETQHKAEKLSKFTEGMFYEQNIHSKGVYAFRDAAVWGTGVLHVFEEEDEVKVERVMPHEIFVDQVEALASSPQQLHRVKPIDREIMLNLVEKWHPEGEEREKAIDAVMTADITSYVDIGGVGSAADLIMVSESWHLPSGKDAKDGLHVICVGNNMIYKEEWKKDYFPFPMVHYSRRLLGFWGQGACERLQNLQGEINRLMILIQRSMWMGGSFKVLIENGSKVVSQHLNNEVGAIINYSGTKPEYVTPPMIQQDIYPYVDSLIAKGFQQEGVSQLQANSMKPEGIDSGAALRTYDQVADDRFLFVIQEVEKFYLEVAKQMIETAKDIYKRRKSYKVLFPQTKFMESIDWADIQLKEDEYVLKAYPTSSLPTEPAGRLQTIQEYMQAGLISPRAGRKLMQMPDVEMSDKLANAPEELLHKIFEDMLHDGKYRPPEPQYDLQLAQQLYLSYYNYADLNNAPGDRMDLLLRFKTQLDDLLGTSAPMPPQGTAPGMPMAAPEAPPTSPLLQNTLNPAAGGLQ